MIMIKVPKNKTVELKSMISEGLHILGRAMSLAEEMYEASEIDYRNDDMEYHDPVMGMRGYRHMGMRDDDYDDDDRMSMRRRRASNGRYSRM